MTPDENTLAPSAPVGPERTDDGPPVDSSRPWGRLGFRVIGTMKIASGLLLAAAGFGIFRMLNRDLGASLEHVVTRLHLDPENWVVHEALSRVAGIDRAHLRAIGLGTFFYALLHLVEGTGLILLKKWAEYLTVVATGSLLPVEVFEIARKVSAVRVGVFLVNVAIVAYLIVMLRHQHKSRV
jgi:uncharacterized membrane protein (DUF2068 family)